MVKTDLTLLADMPGLFDRPSRQTFVIEPTPTPTFFSNYINLEDPKSLLILILVIITISMAALIFIRSHRS